MTCINPLFSIIIPVYNTEKYLARCLDSVVSQTMDDIEILCVDDASTDSCPEILAEYAERDNRLNVWTHAENKTPSISRKEGVERARGKYILFVDSDDALEPDACERLAEEMEKTGADILQFNTTVIAEDIKDPRRVEYLKKLLTPFDGTLSGKDIFLACFDEKKYGYSLWNKCYTAELCKKAFEHVRGIPLPMAEDEYAYLVISYFARSYVGRPDLFGYRYRFGSGLTGKNALTKGQFRKYCRTGLVADEIRDFLLSQEDSEENRRVADKVRKQLRSFCAGEWDLYCREEDKPGEYDEMLRYWPAADVAAEMARIFWNDKARLVRTVEGAASCRTEPRKVRRIGVYYHRMTIGGAESVVDRLLWLWTSMGYECVLITDLPPTENDYPLPESVDRVVIPSYFSLTPDNYDERGRTLEKIVDRYRLDTVVYHAWVATCMLWDVLLLKAKGVAVIAHCHSVASFLLRLGSPQWAELPPVYRLLDGVVTLSDTDRYYWRQFNRRVFTVVNPVPAVMGDAPLATLENPTVLWVGRLSDEKRPYDAIRIFQRVHWEIPEAKLILVGGNDEIPAFTGWLDALARELGVADSVMLTGFQKDIFPWYLTGSVYLMTSEFEGFPLSLMEAGTAGLPCVMYRLDYLTLVRGNRGVFSVETGDMDGAARKIVELLRDPEKRREAGAAAREHVRRVTDVDFAGIWKEIFTSLETEPGEAPIPEDGERMWNTLLEHYRNGVDRKNGEIFQNRQRCERESAYYKQELALVKQSFSFRLGQFLTWPARKTRTFLRCWKEHGFRYTMKVYFLQRKKT